MSRRAPSWLHLALALAAVLAWAALVRHSGRWPSGDGPHVLGASMRLADQLRAGELGLFSRSLGTLLAPHPPGAYAPWTLAYLILGPGRHAHLLASAALLMLCWDGMRRLGGGALSALWFAAPALLWAQAEAGSVDLIAAAAAVQALSHLCASERLSRPGHAAAWGAWMAVGFLSKYTFPMFLWAPCLLAGAWALRERRLRALGLAVAAFLLLAGPWYATHGRSVAAYIGASAAPDPALVAARDLAAGPWWSLENLSWYPAAALDALGWAGLLALATATLDQRLRGRPRDARPLVLLAVAGAWLLLAHNVQRQDRYLLPALPLVAAVAGAARRAGWLSTVAAVSLGSTTWTFAGTGPFPAVRDFGHQLQGAGLSWPRPAEAFRPLSQDPVAWKIDASLHSLFAVQGRRDGTVGLILADPASGGPEAPGMGLYLFRAGALGYAWDLATVSLDSGQPRVFVGPFTTEDWPDRAFKAVFVVRTPVDTSRAAWLTAAGASLTGRLELPRGAVGETYALP